MPKDDDVRLRHMLDAARIAIESATDGERSDRDPGLVWEFGIVKLIEIIGEPASRAPQETRTRLPRVPWAAIVRMRNRLVHAYFDIDHEQVQRTILEDRPGLVQELQLYLATKDQ